MTDRKQNRAEINEESRDTETNSTDKNTETQSSPVTPGPAENDTENGASQPEPTGEWNSTAELSDNETVIQQEDTKRARSGDTTGEKIITTRRPTLRPALLRLGLTVFVGGLLLVPLLVVEQLLGSAALTQLGAIIVGLLLSVAVGRLVVELLILRKTKYLISERGIKRRYSLLGYTKTREVPYGLVRSTELEQKRLQYLFGVSTISLNQGLGDLRLSSVPGYEDFYSEIRDRVERNVTGGNRRSKRKK